ncbi:hypothetical protein CSC18_3484 [Klebsiella aerogenes]|nr:hypothetical protein CSC18_3484 [Klebsiella aerogenes]
MSCPLCLSLYDKPSTPECLLLAASAPRRLTSFSANDR